MNFLRMFKTAKVDNAGMNLFEPTVATQKATFAAGCFWGVESLFGCAKGVIRVRSGYTGGTKAHPSYHDLGDHTEAVDIDFDPKETEYKDLLKLFWANHDPTNYFKRQYMSAIYFHNDEQKLLAEQTLQEEQSRYAKKIVTEIVRASTFYDAEDYHQKYYLRNVIGLFESLKIEGQQVIKSHVAARINGYIAGYGKYETLLEELPNFGLSPSQAEVVKGLVLNPPFRKCH